MPVNVVRIPVPNTQVSIVRIGAQVIDLLEYRVLVMPERKMVVTHGPQQLRANHFVWALVEYGNVDKDGKSEFVEDHYFVLVETETLLPEVAFTLNYIGLGLLPFPNGDLKEYHLFHGGVTQEYIGQDLPKQLMSQQAVGRA